MRFCVVAEGVVEEDDVAMVEREEVGAEIAIGITTQGRSLFFQITAWTE